jgi:CelD/BcsL family acetyltransferase involved in cellulose biosynthesis
MVQVAGRDGYPTAALPMPSPPYVSIADWDESDPRFWGMEHKFQKDLRRRLRNLTAQGSVVLERVDEAAPQILEEFYRLESSGWKGREGSAISSRPETGQFYAEIARAAGRLGYLTLYGLRAGGRMIAGHFGLSYRGRYFSPKIAFDEDFRRFAPGHLIVHHILQDCWERGLREYDITGDADEWKTKWATATRSQNHCLIFRKSAWGRMLHALQFSVKPGVKKLLGRGPGNRIRNSESGAANSE